MVATDDRPKGDPRAREGAATSRTRAWQVVPYGVYDVGANARLGDSRSDHKIRLILPSPPPPLAAIPMGRERYPTARELTITPMAAAQMERRVRCGRSNCKKLSDSGYVLTSSIYPPGPSKWNKIEHRPCSAATSQQTWRGGGHSSIAGRV